MNSAQNSALVVGGTLSAVLFSVACLLSLFAIGAGVLGVDQKNRPQAVFRRAGSQHFLFLGNEFVDHAWVGQGRGIAQSGRIPGGNLAQDTAHDFA